MFENIFETANSGFAQALYEDFLRDPASVPPEWRALFDVGLRGEDPATTLDASGREPEATGQGSAAPADSEARPSPAPAEAASVVTTDGTTPITGPALRLLQNMEASLTVPTATSFRDIDVSLLWDRRRQLNAELNPRGLKLSFTHLIGWAIVLAAKHFPTMVQAVVHVSGTPHRTVPEGLNLGLAVDVQRKDGSRGLLVPVIHDADKRSFAEFHEEYERLVAGARGSKLLPNEYQGGTITLTNPGTLGTVASVPRLMAGQGSIIATGAIRMIAGARMMTMSSTYDHRIIQGAESGLFLQWVDKLLQGEDGFYTEIASSLGLDPARIGTPSPTTERSTVTAVRSVAPDLLYHIAAGMSLVRAHRTHGYLAAQLDPLGTAPVGDPALNPERLGLTPEVMTALPADVFRIYVPGNTLAEALPVLRETYCGTIAYELEHIASHEQRVWLRRVIESGQHRQPLRPEERRRLFDDLVRVEALETFLHRSYLGHKRFGIEGLDMLVPMLGWALSHAARSGVTHAVMGMAHRGRLNVLAHILGVPYETLLAEFEGGREVEETLAPKGGTGDVKYHHGWNGVYTAPEGNTISAILMPNPSHLEAVNPVVEGYTRALQTQQGSNQPDSLRCLPILIHGDAAFAAQGVVAETFNLSKLAGYATGGTLHVITNNQVGFTTGPTEARSTDFASDLAKGFDIPIIHVNADDPEACIAAVRLAMLYRDTYASDCVIDLVGYRRHGHNEGDEPRYTQPMMYQRIDEHPAVRTVYANTLISQEIITAQEVENAVEREYNHLLEVQRHVQEEADLAGPGEEPVRTGQFEAVIQPSTAVERDVITSLNDQLLRVPDGFTIHPKLKRQLQRRHGMSDADFHIDWAHAEALAFGTLLRDGVPIRLTGQDTERGTFSQRHLVFHDVNNGNRYTPMAHIDGASATFELHNSPLSEYAALGFEYGYSVGVPKALVLWEAQFGDFVNGAEIVIDQFIAAGLAKWGQTSRLVLLLPHGYEGQGPEHSSARVERFLAIAAEGNIRVANCSTPAQYFHLLRRQALHGEQRPLVIMTPKSLLRHPQATSALGDITDGRFYPVLDDHHLPRKREDVSRLVLCSGKVYYDLITDPSRAGASHVAIGRIEELYPFPESQVADLLATFPRLREVRWVQEEPSNFGPRKFLVPRIAALLKGTVTISSTTRPERSSPAEGYPAAHQAEQRRIVQEALA